jgi:hypothetical protein
MTALSATQTHRGVPRDRHHLESRVVKQLTETIKAQD